jgi:hypothetical protein
MSSLVEIEPHSLAVADPNTALTETSDSRHSRSQGRRASSDGGTSEDSLSGGVRRQIPSALEILVAR